jgi:hypothetical protein
VTSHSRRLSYSSLLVHRIGTLTEHQGPLVLGGTAAGWSVAECEAAAGCAIKSMALVMASENPGSTG